VEIFFSGRSFMKKFFMDDNAGQDYNYNLPRSKTDQFIGNVIKTWPERKDEFFDFINNSGGGGRISNASTIIVQVLKRILASGTFDIGEKWSTDSVDDKLVRTAINMESSVRYQRNIDCFLAIFPLMKDVDDKYKSEDLKLLYHRHAAANRSKEMMKLLIDHDFLPRYHDFRARVIQGDLSFLHCLQSPLTSSFENKEDEETRKWLITNMERVIDLSRHFIHRPVNQTFLKAFLSVPLIKDKIDFYARVKQQNCTSSADEKSMILMKIFIEVGDSSDYNYYFDRTKYKMDGNDSQHDMQRLGQVFINLASSNILSLLTNRIDSLIFLIEHGGTKIDRVLQFRKRELDEIFLQLIVRKIEFETKYLQLFQQVENLVKELQKMLEEIFCKDVVSIILDFF
jgi:hypothetical protein